MERSQPVRVSPDFGPAAPSTTGTVCWRPGRKHYRGRVNDYLPEPRDVGPIAGGDLRASDRDRDLVTQVLTTAYSDGRLTRGELDQRIESAMNAKTFDDLTPLTRDLVPMNGQPTTQVVSATPSSSKLIDTSTVNPEPERLIGIFGGSSRKGRIRVRKETKCLALFGGFDLDWREATFEASEVVIRGGWVFGGLDLKLPGGVGVRDETVGIFGGTDVKDTTEDVPGGPTVVIKGLCLFGGVSIRGPKPPRKKK